MKFVENHQKISVGSVISVLQNQKFKGLCLGYKMVFLYWDFETSEELKNYDPLVRQDLALAFKKLGIPISNYVSGFDNPYVLIYGDDPAQNSPAWKDGMIMRAGFITRIEVRHLTYQSDEFIEKIKDTAKKVFKKWEKK